MSAPAHLIKTARRQMRKIRHRGPQTETERRLLASADQQREQGLGWRYDGFREWSNAQLFSALAGMSIVTDESTFQEDARQALSVTPLAQKWEAQSTAQGKWRDFPMLAARELWRRLLPSLACPEIVADQVDELLEDAAVNDQPAELWLKAGRVLVDACGASNNANQDFFKAVVRESGSDLSGWMVEVPAALLGTPFASQAPQWCEEFARLIDAKTMQAERAEVLARLGHADQARTQIESLLARYSTDPLVLLKAHAVYQALHETELAQDFMRRYQHAMQQPETADSRVSAAHVGVMMPTPNADSKQVPGPNTPCPCGSGKKYKRCHGLPS